MNFIKSHPVLAYYVITFVISCAAFVMAVGGPGGIPGTPESINQLMLMAILGLLAGPSVAGLLTTGLVNGKAGYRDFLSRLLKWRVGIRWYAIALLTAPLLFTTVLLSLSLLSPTFLPGIFTTSDRAGLLLFGLIVGLMAGFFEEIGWTGFAIPNIRKRYSVLATGLIVGLLWAAWHMLPALWFSGASSGTLSLTSYLLDPFLFLVMFRVLMVWVYDRTRSLLLGMLMHVSLTSSTRIFGPIAGFAGVNLMAFDITWFTAMCIIVAVAIRGGKGKK